MNTSLLIMAAGIGSRFGGGIKQLEPVGMHGEIIMDYSIHDAIEAGFNKIVFIIREEIQNEFRKAIGERIEKVCERLDVEVDYAFQDLQNLPRGVKLPEGRKKPWGTGQAVLACKYILEEPFAVINADDYYGKEAFVKIHDFLQNYTPASASRLCMAGFELKNTLSDNGGVTRGICKMEKKGFLTSIDETHNIVKKCVDGVCGAYVGEEEIASDSLVSMNMWGLTPEFVEALDEGFLDFFRGLEPDSEEELKAEYLLPIFIDELLKKSMVTVKVLKSQDRWFGVTYKEDKENVVQSFKELIEKGVYKEDLFSDL